jgi:MFS family permease
VIATLRQRNFALLWLGGLISLIGDWALLVGLPIYIFLLTRSVLATSILLLAERVPGVLLGSVAGVFVDRWDRKRTMVIANLLLALGLLPLLLARTADLVWIVYAVALAESCVQQFFTPAESALLPALVGKEHLVAANSLNSVSANLARLVGPALGGVVAGLLGLTGIVLVDAASFLIAGVLIALITIAVGPAAAPDARAASTDAGGIIWVWREWVAGLRAILSDRTLSVLLGVAAFTALGEGVFGVLFPVFVSRVLHGGAPQIGELMSAQAVGGLLGGLLVGMAGRRVMSRWSIGLCGTAFGLIDLAIFNSPAFFPVFWLSVGLFVAVGIPGIGMLAGVQSLAQATAPADYRGRVFGAYGALAGLLGLIGTVIAGTVTDQFGVVPVLNIQGVGYVLAGMALLALLPRHKERPTRQGIAAVEQEAVAPAEIPSTPL